MNWRSFALKLPTIIGALMQVVQKIQSATGAEKKAAVLEAVPESIALVEFAAGRDVLNDAVIAELMSVYIDAEKAAMRAKAALAEGILARSAP